MSSIIGLLIGVIGLLWTIWGNFQNSKLRRLILSEKDFILDKTLDIRQYLENQRSKLVNDRKAENDETLNQVSIRIEDLNGIISNLDRFVERLKNLSKK